MDVSEERALFDVTQIDYSSYQLYSVTMANTYERYINFFKPNNYINHSLEPYFKEILNHTQPDVVHFHSLQGMGVNLIKIAKEWGAKTVYSVHDCWWFCPYLFMTDMDGFACDQTQIDFEICEQCVEKIMYLPEAEELEAFNPRVFLTLRNLTIKTTIQQFVDIVLPVSKFIGRFFAKNDIQPQRLSVFENGVKVKSNQNKTIEKPIVDRPIRFGFVGGKNPQKGFEILMDAMACVTNEQIQLNLYGVEDNHPDLQAQWNRPELAEKCDQIHACGKYDESEKEAIFENMDVLIFPSICNESAPLAIREALRLGTPVIASRCGDPETMIQHGVNGALIARNDAEALANMIEYVASQPEQLAAWQQAIDCDAIPHVSERATALVEIYRSEGL
jgi:glycosyltransferase involved in cell wall biosynthesis